MDESAIDLEARPSGTGCLDCPAAGTWWFHLRRCAACGHVGCCDSSPGRHASAHFTSTGHRLMQSFEPGEDWFWDYVREEQVDLQVVLAPPLAHPLGQQVPGPPGSVPKDWRMHLGGSGTARRPGSWRAHLTKRR